jgi:hypothetical protein
MESTERGVSDPTGLWEFASHIRAVTGTTGQSIALTGPTEPGAPDPMGLRSSAGHISANGIVKLSRFAPGWGATGLGFMRRRLRCDIAQPHLIGRSGGSSERDKMALQVKCVVDCAQVARNVSCTIDLNLEIPSSKWA